MYSWEQRGRYESGLRMHRSNFTTSEHDVKRRRLRLWTVYEQATACPGPYVCTGHTKFNDFLCVKGDFKSIGNRFLIVQPDASPALQAAGYEVLSLTDTDSHFVRYIMEVFSTR